MLTATQKRKDYPGGLERAMDEVKANIVSLYFYDRLLNDLGALKGMRRPDMKFIYNSLAEELFPILARITPCESETLNMVDYSPARARKRRQVLGDIPARQIPSALITSLHDDNIGVIPQLMTGSLHELILDIRRHGWAGYSMRYWQISDHDACVTYLAKAAWDEQATPESVYRDQVRAACGEEAVEDMLRMCRELEATTVALEWHGLGLAFPVPGAGQDTGIGARLCGLLGRATGVRGWLHGHHPHSAPRSDSGSRKELCRSPATR